MRKKAKLPSVETVDRIKLPAGGFITLRPAKRPKNSILEVFVPAFAKERTKKRKPLIKKRASAKTRART